MAGLNQDTIAHDPAYVRYNNMAMNRHKHFRWTGRTARITFTYVVVVPAIIGYFAYKTDGKWDMQGKRRGDTIAEF